jgi:hypothetical protein
MTMVSQSTRNCCKSALASMLGSPQNGLAYTILISPNFSSKFASLTLMVGPIGTLATEGMENLRRVFSAMVFGTDGFG